MSPDIWKTVNSSMKDDKIGDRDNLRISNLLHLLTCEQDRWRTAWCCLNCTSSFAICPIELTMCSAWGSWCTCAYLVLSQMLHNRIPRNWSLIWHEAFYQTGQFCQPYMEWHLTYKLWGVFCLFWSSGFIWQRDPLLSFIAKQINSNVFPLRWIIDYLTEELMNMTVVHYMFSC